MTTDVTTMTSAFGALVAGTGDGVYTANRIEKNKPDILVSEIPEALNNIYEMAEFGEDSELHAYDLGVIDTLKGFDKVLRDLKNKIIDLS